MQNIPLNILPNQTFSISLDNFIYDITLKTTIFVTSVSITRNNIPIVSNSRATPGFPILPYLYEEQGNFIIVTANNEYPHYSQFGITQFLIYASQTELEEIRAGTFVT